jgi:hypothetical protein
MKRGRPIKISYNCQCGATNANEFYPKNKSKCKNCLRKVASVRYHNLNDDDKKKYIEYNKVSFKNWASNNIIRVRVLAAKHRAKKKGLEFDIDVNFITELLITQEYKCKYSGVLLNTTEIGSETNFLNPNTLSIDRLDSKKGYTRDNVVLVTAIVNSMKNDLSETDFMNVIKLVAGYTILNEV